MSLRRRGAPVLVVAASLVLSSCSFIDDVRQRVRPTVSHTPQSPPAGTTGLERFYSQRLSWRDCSGGQCASLTVPVDYAHPDAASIELALLKVPAGARSQRLGSLVVNPGGPGGSGVDYARAADFIVGAPVRRRFDVVGFDPRGVVRSAPITCLDDAGLDDFLGTDPTPDSAVEEAGFAQVSQGFAQACGRRGGDLLAHVSTVEVAKDMDVLRAALGENRLNYLGKSYGTFIGSTYAGLFPDKVGRFVLDGVVPPELSATELDLGQAKGFELATRTWAAYCVKEGDCPLGDSVDAVMANLRAFLAKVDATPLAKTGDTAVTRLTEGWASTGIAVAMYDEGMWASLVDAMRDALRGDGSALMSMADQYAERDPGGHYTSNIMQVIYAVNCLDRPDGSTLAEHQAQATAAAKAAPTWGKYLMWSSLPCGYWPVKGTEAPHTIAAEGSAPIVVVGTTRDPATPYEWSVMLRRELDNAVLLTYDGDGHTAYTRSNACIDDPIDRYYVDGTVPKDGLMC